MKKSERISNSLWHEQSTLQDQQAWWQKKEHRWSLSILWSELVRKLLRSELNRNLMAAEIMKKSKIISNSFWQDQQAWWQKKEHRWSFLIFVVSILLTGSNNQFRNCNSRKNIPRWSFTIFVVKICKYVQIFKKLNCIVCKIYQNQGLLTYDFLKMGDLKINFCHFEASGEVITKALHI